MCSARVSTRRCATTHDAPRVSESLVSLRRVTRRHGAVAAVDDLSLDIEAGEFFALLGPSGCGKTSLLRLIAGLDVPDAGAVLIEGRDVTHVPANLRPSNMMFQSYALFPHMTVDANIAYGLVRQRLGPAEIAARVAEMKSLMQIDDLGSRRPSQLSGGQAQRVALARALVRRPKLLLLDEPLAALDRRLREQTQSELARLQARLKITFVIVTHDQDEAMGLATRMAVMRDGRIEQAGNPRALYERPASRTVARFLGETTLFEGSVVAADDARVVVATAEGNLTIAARQPWAPGTPVAISIRPEHIRRAEDEAINRLAATIVSATFLGDSTRYRLQLETGASVLMSRSSSSKPDADLRPGCAIVCTFDPASAVVLGA